MVLISLLLLLLLTVWISGAVFTYKMHKKILDMYLDYKAHLTGKMVELEVRKHDIGEPKTDDEKALVTLIDTTYSNFESYMQWANKNIAIRKEIVSNKILHALTYQFKTVKTVFPEEVD